MPNLSPGAERLMRHLNDNVWVGKVHAINQGYEAAITELLTAGLVTEELFGTIPIILIATKKVLAV